MSPTLRCRGFFILKLGQSGPFLVYLGITNVISQNLAGVLMSHKMTKVSDLMFHFI